MENTTKETSEITKQIGEKIEQNASHWSDILKEVVDKLTGKNMDVTYNFENFEIDVPKATGPDGRDLGSARWKINGKFIFSTQLLDKPSSTE
ncbi:MAG: hypothetical protein QN784_08680 [Nitrososphaeraceae archaeon]|jgi:hypothetical protein|nr:hypothetical protein [Nitrososphaeraceae archaeon]MDW0169243.1 hypothetical protein [Nitrososphaeraceae archaeon]MDW0171214.1 hypothetical protein [Nitrososphaeraceae archaeon]MDW0173151.1 hypothetical protein [Nitrososphaeraceae archaeon]MDW0177444.1 hypothetical protein [Nitrososphaeraceae archaeon]